MLPAQSALLLPSSSSSTSRREHPPHHHHHHQQQQQQQQEQQPWYVGVLWAVVSTMLVLGLYSVYDERTQGGEASPDMSIRSLMSRTTRGMQVATGQGDGPGTAFAAPALAQDKTLVVYNVHHDTSPLDSLHGENLHFFLEVGVGVETDERVDYVFLVFPPPYGRAYTKPAFPNLPNVRVMERPRDCLGGSGLQDLLRSHHDETPLFQLDDLVERYTSFVFLDSSVRGPFLPRYMHRPRVAPVDAWAVPQPTQPWTSVLTDKLGPKVKLVGRTVSCKQEMHVQAPVWATDRVGLQTLLDARVLECALDPETHVEQYELGATRSILGAGYEVDCLMLRYQGLNLTQVRERGLPCSAGGDPSVPFLNDGLPINPLEVVFVVATPHLVASDPLLRRYTDYFLGRVSLEDNDVSSDRVQAAIESRRQNLARIVEDCGATLDIEHFASRCPGCTEEDSLEAVQTRFLEKEWLVGYDYRFTVAETDTTKLPYHYCEPFVRYQAPDLTT